MGSAMHLPDDRDHWRRNSFLIGGGDEERG
jgi:hypothetical protein